jgi:hypothetical protein
MLRTLLLLLIPLLAPESRAQEKLAACEKANRCRLITYALRALPDADRIPREQILIVRDLDAFLNKNKITDPSKRTRLHGSQLFVLGGTFPIYINAERPDFDNLNASNIQENSRFVFAWAGMLAHEAVHARGEQSEAKAFLHELDVLRAFQKREGFVGEDAERYISAVEELYRKAVADEHPAHHLVKSV